MRLAIEIGAARPDNTTLKLGLDSVPLGPARFELLEQIAALMEDIA